MDARFTTHPDWPPDFVPIHPVAETFIAILMGLKTYVRGSIWPRGQEHACRLLGAFCEVVSRLAWAMHRIALKPPGAVRPRQRTPRPGPTPPPGKPERRWPPPPRQPAQAFWLARYLPREIEALQAQAGTLRDFLSHPEVHKFLAEWPGFLRRLRTICRGLGITEWPQAPPGLFPPPPPPPDETDEAGEAGDTPDRPARARRKWLPWTKRPEVLAEVAARDAKLDALYPNAPEWLRGAVPGSLPDTGLHDTGARRKTRPGD